MGSRKEIQFIHSPLLFPRAPPGQAPQLQAQIFARHQQPPYFLNCIFSTRARLLWKLGWSKRTREGFPKEQALEG